MDAATGNECRPKVAIDDMSESAADAMGISAGDDDQADHQHEI